jgi:flagellar basal-body rod protein FlgF
MADSRYVGMNAAAARLRDLDAVADNLANVETPGFRGSRPIFQSVVRELTEGDVSQVHVTAVGDGVDERSGPAIETGSPLDVRLADGSWLAVTLEDGTTGYTRDGRLSVDADGLLRAGTHPVHDDTGQPVVVQPGASVRIGDRGEVFANGELTSMLGQHAIDGPLTRVRPSVVVGLDAGRVSPVATPVQVGMREGSSVSGLDSAIRLIGAQRAYDEAMQAIQTASKLDERASELGRLRG